MFYIKLILSLRPHILSSDSTNVFLNASLISPAAREMLVTRHEQYKAAAMQAKTAGDLKTATKYLGVSKVT